MIDISKEQKSIIIGTLLGDGYIYKDRFGFHYLEVKHSDAQKDYVFWMHKKLKPFSSGLEPKQRRDNYQWRFTTKSNNDLVELRNLFYPEGIKIVPKNIPKLLIDPLSLAVWYMDDGSLDFRPKSHFAFSLKTNAFKLKECRLLSKVLKENFGLETSVQYPICRGKRYPQIYIGKQGRDKFIKLIDQYIIPCFQYKLPQYRTLQRLNLLKVG